MRGPDYVRELSITCNCGIMLTQVTHDSIINPAKIPDDSFLCGLSDWSPDEEPIVLLAPLRGSGLDSIMIDAGAGYSACWRTHAQEHGIKLGNKITSVGILAQVVLGNPRRLEPKWNHIWIQQVWISVWHVC